jgi:hypothetical protein
VSLKSRMERLEREALSLREAGVLPESPAEVEDRQRRTDYAHTILAATMSREHQALVVEYWRRRAEWEALPEGERGPHNPAPQEGRMLGRRYLDMVSGYVNGSSRPLSLPPEVARVYLEDHLADHLLDCEQCGFEAPVRLLKDLEAVIGPRPEAGDAFDGWALRRVRAEQDAIEDPSLRLDYFTACPLCGGRVGGRPYPMGCAAEGSFDVGQWEGD